MESVPTQGGRSDRRSGRRIRGGRAKEDGAALVEFAIIAPVLFLLLFGILEFGIAFNDYQSIRQGVREGARQAVVNDFGSTISCGLNGPASSAPDNAKRVLCLTKERTGLGSTVRVGLRLIEAPPDGHENDSVRVCAIREIRSVTKLFSPLLDGRELRSEIEMRVEKPLSLAAGDYLENDPSGEAWAWC